MTTTVAAKSRENSPVDPMVPEVFRIRKVRRDTADTFTMELSHAHTDGGIPFRPGQFNMLYVFGVGEVPISISGDPTKPSPLIHTIRSVGAVTKVMRLLKAGDTIGVRGPYGTSWPVEAAKGCDVVIVAGGIGLAPLRPSLHYILNHRAEYGKVVLLYGTRTPADILYRSDLERWRSHLDLEVHATVDRAASDWRGNVGVVTTLIPKAGFDPENTVAMVCGPELMMRFTILGLQKRGVPLTSVFLSVERNMKCGVGLCGHCQFGPKFACKDGPVFRYGLIKEYLGKREM